MSGVQSEPLEPGLYYVLIRESPAQLGAWVLWLGANTAVVRVNRSEFTTVQDGTSRLFVSFEVLATTTAFPVASAGFQPQKHDKPGLSPYDVSRPPPPPGEGALSSLASMFQGAGGMLLLLVLVLALGKEKGRI